MRSLVKINQYANCLRNIIAMLIHQVPSHVRFIAWCEISETKIVRSRSQWPHGLRRGSAANRLLGLQVRIPPGAWMSVRCECRVLSGRGLCVG